MTPIEKLGQAISDALDEAPAGVVLSVLTGAFVGVTVGLCRRQGHDDAKPITVDGGKERDVTIHAPKGVAAVPSLPAWWPAFIQLVGEIDGRNSPEDEPDAMVATASELEACALSAIERAAQS